MASTLKRIDERMYRRGVTGMLRLVTAAVMLFAMTSVGNAAVTVFTDNFDNENGGVGVFNFVGFTNWTVTQGAVDLIGNGFFDFLPGNGLYVDMDGTMSQAGTMLSVGLNLQPGSYSLSYELAGNQRDSSPEQVIATVETGLTTRTVSLGASAPFTTFTDSFVLISPQTVNIQFEASGADNLGMLLDDVELVRQDGAVIPEPGSLVVWSLLGCVAVTVGWRRRNNAG